MSGTHFEAFVTESLDQTGPTSLTWFYTDQRAPSQSYLWSTGPVNVATHLHTMEPLGRAILSSSL
jgi:hypothetical protein